MLDALEAKRQHLRVDVFTPGLEGLPDTNKLIIPLACELLLLLLLYFISTLFLSLVKAKFVLYFINFKSGGYVRY